MNPSPSSPDKKQPDGPDHASYAAWGALLGAMLGLTVGAFTQHWLAWTIIIASVCLITGAFIDRMRR